MKPFRWYLDQKRTNFEDAVLIFSDRSCSDIQGHAIVRESVVYKILKCAEKHFKKHESENFTKLSDIGYVCGFEMVVDITNTRIFKHLEFSLDGVVISTNGVRYAKAIVLQNREDSIRLIFEVILEDDNTVTPFRASVAEWVTVKYIEQSRDTRKQLKTLSFLSR
jgi:hypothetical protein